MKTKLIFMILLGAFAASSMTGGMREASWSAPVLPPSRRAIAPLRRDGGWRFGPGAAVTGNVSAGVLRLTEPRFGRLSRLDRQRLGFAV